MTDNKSLFDEQNSDPSPESQSPSPITPMNELVGEGKKYATVEKALEALAHAQAHIQKIESENGDLRVKASSAVSTEEVYKTVQELLKAERATPTPAVVDEATIAGLLDRKLTEREAKQTADHNAQVVKDALKEKFSEKAEEVYKAKAAENGFTLAEFNALIGKSPKAALKLLGLEEGQRQAPAISRGSINPAALQGQPQNPAPRKSVMAGATTSEMLASWRESVKKSQT